MTTRTEHFEFGDEHPRLSIDVPAGEVILEPGPGGQMTVALDGPRADEFEVTASGGAVAVRYRDGKWLSGRSSVRIVATVPMGTDLDVQGASLDVRSRVGLGSVRGRTASGDLSLTTATDVSIKSASGTVSVDVVTGDLRASLASGDIRAGTIEGDLDISSASGDVDVDAVSGRVEVSTASGDLRIGCCSGSDLACKTVSGDASIGVPRGTRADLDVKTLSGDVRLPPGGSHGIPDEDRVRRRLTFKSVSGDIELKSV